METCQEQILILHGWGRFTGSWTPVKELLEKQGYQVFYPPFPGLDENQPLNSPWTIDDYVEWAKTYADKNGLADFFLLGHSFGGRVSIKFAVKYPEKLKGLILVSAAGIRNKKISKVYNLFAKLSKAINKLSFIPGYQFCRKALYRLILRKTDYVTLKTQTMKETFKNVIEEDLAGQLAQIKTPTLILWGDKDKTTPLSDGKFMERMISGSLLRIIAGAPHMIHVDAPEKVAQEILDFVNRHE
ncbi:MAG: alpha/beta hydrolase [bacterium]|nr:alpha/beta hydrolase [bacterium]